MSKRAELKDVLDLFRKTVTPEEVIRAMLDAKISSDITRIRIARGLSQKDFAEQIGVTQGLVSRWESGDSNYTIATLAKIAAACGLDIRISIHDPKMTPATVTVLNDYKQSRGFSRTQKYSGPYYSSNPAKEG